MKTLATILAALAAAASAVAIGMFANSDFSVGPGTVARVPFSLRSPDIGASPPELSARQRRTVMDTLAGEHRRVERVEVLAESFTQSSYVDSAPGDKTRYSMEIHLKDGTVLSSRLRTTATRRFADALDNCLRHCLAEYDARLERGLRFRQLSNL